MIVWWAAAIFWLPGTGAIAPYSAIVMKFNEGSCKFEVQSIAKKNNVPYSEIPECVQSTLSSYQAMAKAKPRWLPIDGQYERVVYFCPARGKCREVE